MIIKSFNLNDIKKSKSNCFLLYGENDGHKEEAISNYFLKVERPLSQLAQAYHKFLIFHYQRWGSLSKSGWPCQILKKLYAERYH